MLWICFLALLSACAVETTGLARDSGINFDAARPDGGRLDAGQPDSGGRVDASASDAGGPDAAMPPSCPVVPDAETIAYYDFTAASGVSVVPDRVDGHDARVLDGNAATVAGPVDCGEAFRFNDESAPYLVISDDANFDLSTGSLDMYLYVDAGLSRPRGVLARDAAATLDPGHLRIRIDADGTLFARIQDGGDVDLRSADALPTERWLHFGLNWGSGRMELWIDGVLSASSDRQVGIDGNDNPWTVGATNDGSLGGADPPNLLRNRDPAISVDSLRISRIRRDFSAFTP